MKKKTMLYLLFIFSPVILFGMYVAFMLIFGTVTNFKPEEKIVLKESKTISNELNDSVVSFLSWNIGYSSLGNKADFFLDGGENIRSPKPEFQRYLNGINRFLATQKDKDFILLQEVDENSKRSFFTNEYELFSKTFTEHSAVFTENFKVNYIPVPMTSNSPLGKVKSGLATYSKFTISENIRLQYPGEYDWPKRIFHLDRCLLLSRVSLENGKELVVINSHNSAYDGGQLKPLEMEYLKALLLEEYDKGNYVIVGADWNQCPPNFAYDSFAKGNADDYFQSNIEEDFLPNGWTWSFDTKTPTNRKLSAPYEKGKTFTTLIDFYLVSPNVKVLEVETIDLDFAFSDHQPVSMKIKLQ
jgi:endonuclease/exonuclease/phosphatase family metal-dependent hydrolase